MNTPNPYSAPSNGGETNSGNPHRQDQSLGNVAKRVFLAWERLRLYYIAILAVETVALGIFTQPGIRVPEFWIMAIMGAAFVNVCFFLGPIIETYVAWLGHPSTTLRFAMFITGTVFSCFMVPFAVRYLSFQLSN